MIETWQEILMYTVKNRKEKFAIYPFGGNGLEVKHFLNNVLGVLESLRIDRQYSQYTDYIIDINALKENDKFQEYIYIITSMTHNFAQELLIQGVPEQNIVFCYPCGTYVSKLCAYYDAVWFLIRQLNPKSIYDADLLLGEQIGKSLYSGIEHQEKLLRNIALYTDEGKTAYLFPAQREKYEKIHNDYFDIVLFIDNFDDSKKELANNLDYKTMAIVSKMPVGELAGHLKFMYGYLYIYVLGKNEFLS